MRAKCIETKTPGSRLTLNREYNVLAIEFEPSQGVLFRIIGDDRITPALFAGELFEITDSAIPAIWVIGQNNRGWYAIGPPPWIRSGFWEQFFHGEPTAVAAFEEQCRLMKLRE